MNNMPVFFLKNILWKIISLILAFFLWFSFMNINNPEATKNFRVPLTLENESNILNSNLVLINKDELENTIIVIKVKSQTSMLDILTPKDIKAFIDFKPIDLTNSNNVGKSLTVRVNIVLPTGYEYVTSNPRNVEVMFDTHIEESFNVSANVSGKPKDGYDIGKNILIDPSKVIIKGGKETVSKISTVEVQVDVTDASEDVESTSEILVYDIDGKNITNNFDISHNEAAIIVPVKLNAKIPVQGPSWSGLVASGYNITNVTWTPQYVEVVGLKEDIDKQKNIILDPVNVNGATEDVIVDYSVNELLQGSGLEVKTGTPSTIKVHLKVEKILSKRLSVNIGNFAIQNQTDSVELPSTVEVVIFGTDNNINNVTEKDIVGTIDLSEAENGNNSVTVNVKPIKNITVKSPLKVDVIYKEDDTPIESQDTETIQNINPTESIETVNEQ